MLKRYVVRLSNEERQTCQEDVKKLKGTSQKVRRAQILLKTDADGPAWTDARIADALSCRVQTVENLRKRVVLDSFESPSMAESVSTRRLSRSSLALAKQN
jgi:hypothetical protein